MIKDDNKNKQRNTSFEVLRIVSMLMILTLHTLLYSNMLGTPLYGNNNFYFAYLLESGCIIAVNCYVLISGYFLIDSTFRLKKFITLWVEILFYSLGITLFMYLINFADIFAAKKTFIILPVLSSQYWFATCYLVLYALSPFINKLVKSLTKEEYKKLLILLFLIFTFLKTLLPMVDSMDRTAGYGIAWFICLYIYAGYIKLHYKDNGRKLPYLFGYLITSLLLFASKVILNYLGNCNILGSYPNMYEAHLYDYNSIFVLLSSVMLFLFFKNLNIKNKVINKIILFFAPLTFGVYLIHEHVLMRSVLWSNICKYYLDINKSNAMLKVPVIAISLFIIFSVIDYIRKCIFKLLITSYTNIIKNRK